MTALGFKHPDKRRMPTFALLPFVVLTFAITWGLTGLYILAPAWAVARFGALSGTHPIFVAATWGPAFAAFVLVLGYSGIGGLRGFLARLLLWRVPWAWAAFLLLGIPLIFIAGALAKGEPALQMPDGGMPALFGAAVIMLFLGPIEEFGWRGVMQPLLQRLMAPIWAGVIIGAVWGLWHLPAFHLAGTLQSGWAFWPFFLGNVALAVIVTPLLNASRGSILLPMLFHWQLINPLWPDAQPYDIAFFVLAALLVLWLNRKAMVSRTGAVRDVFPDAGSES